MQAPENERVIKALPKVEQHIHLIGSIRAETLLWLAEQGDIKAPYETVEGVREFFRFRDFTHFISLYSHAVDCVTEESQLERVTYEMLQDDARCNVHYAEASFSAPDHVRKGLDYGKMIDAINRGIRRARNGFGIECNIRIDLVRNYGPKAAMEVLDWIEDKDDNVVSIDIGGSEEKFPPRPFAPVFRRAKEMGLHLVAHAGEAAGPDSIWDAVKFLQAEHIGHGIAASNDPRLMNYLRSQSITIEMCPISNVRTGVIASLDKCPIRTFLDQGLRVTVNSDDPAMFGTNLNNEFLQLHRTIGLTVHEISGLCLNAVDSSFLPAKRKRAMRASFKKGFQRLMDQN